MKKTIIITAMLLSALSASAQKWSISTNAAEWANLGTINADGSVAAGRHTTFGVGFRYNPWSFGSDGDQFQNKQRTAYVYGRWWPWNIYSGWWLGGKAQVEEFNQGGIFKRKTEEGNAYGAGLSGGYTLMLHKNLNLDFGAGFWGGYTMYTVYECPTCGRIADSGSKWFIMPSDLIMSLVYVF